MDSPAAPDVARWTASLLHTADSFYPTGSYAHSFGLEGLAQAGVVTDRATLGTFLLDYVLPPLSRTDLPVAAQAFAAAGSPVDWERLRSLCLLASSLRGSREPRGAAEAIGGQRLDLAAALHGGLAADFNEKARAGGWPRPSCVAAAIEARTLGVPRDAMLAGIVYATSAALLSAAVKLLRLGQNAVHTLLAEALARAPALVEEALAVDPGEAGTFNPWWDIAAARHETADFRLFIS